MPSFADRITAVKAAYGSKLAILGHHYQSDAIIRHVDVKGDSLELARKIEGLAAEHVVFCGVFFMAESAAALARPGQRIHIPRTDADCPMAEMAPAQRVEHVLTALNSRGRKVVPLTYVNSSAAVKAVCARFGGSVCTSANASTMLAWARGQGEAVLFLPDKNLGNNTADQLGIAPSKRLELDIRAGGGKLDLERAAEAELLLWPGCCAIHHKFKLHHVTEMRTARPGVSVIVHPECAPEVVQAADGAGSTTFLIKHCAQAAPGSVIAIGTELNLVRRLAAYHAAEGKVIVPLKELTCSNMAKITEEGLANMLEQLETATPVTLDPLVTQNSRLALERMLRACA
jgi:quinolinate synthetase complex, A subunit